jgi:uncharacterized membrane protein
VNHPSFVIRSFLPKVIIQCSPEQVVTNKKDLQAGKQSKPTAALPAEPWISMRSGTIIITFTSIGMAVLTAIQVIPVRGWVEGVLWGLLFGGLIWAIFFGLIFVNRFLKR